MKAKREITALDCAICLVMSVIDETMVFVPTIKWKYRFYEFGVNVLVEDQVEKIDGVQDKRVFIYPVTWPDNSFISCRFMKFQKFDTPWNIVEGVICAHHIAGMENSLTFKFHEGIPPYIVSRGTLYKKELEQVAMMRKSMRVSG